MEHADGPGGGQRGAERLQILQRRIRTDSLEHGRILPGDSPREVAERSEISHVIKRRFDLDEKFAVAVLLQVKAILGGAPRQGRGQCAGAALAVGSGAAYRVCEHYC
ncbi:hypothetical protein D3C85_1213320 [compost metagenome]